MGIRIYPVPWAGFFVLLGLLDSVRGLAGRLSEVIGLSFLFFVLASITQTVLTYFFCGFHQNFSTDHPVRGIPVDYDLSIHNQSPFPSSRIICRFSLIGPALEGNRDRVFFLGGKKSTNLTFSFSCAYRGVYALGLRRLVFRDVLGLLDIEYVIEPRIFYVFPEIVSLKTESARIAEGQGEFTPFFRTAQTSSGARDYGVFDTLRILRPGEGSSRVAWKRFAATGIPQTFVEAALEERGLSVALDLRPSSYSVPEERKNELLLAEDLAVSAVFSILRLLMSQGIPVEFRMGSQESCRLLTDFQSWEAVYAVSTGIHFKDPLPPLTATPGGKTTLIVSLRSIADGDHGYGISPFELLEVAERNGHRLILLIVPPPSCVAEEQERMTLALERLLVWPNYSLCQVLDTRRGKEGIADALA